ncbi:hypothetical protein CDAR_540161 [Caerostris darwini]|uniref:RNase H type-1 domain-containing protein n=1 Tax=Caerostris darwini TaxID=1538125 RepID=A0AAV4WV41_9ARAC|nr:hypothetical protein CDAR_540161 [Caerostris darwini]
MHELAMARRMVFLHWVKAHGGYVGNEFADESAKQATKLGDDMAGFLHTARFGLTESALCQCGEICDVRHYLSSCPTTEFMRRHLKFRDITDFKALIKNPCNIYWIQQNSRHVNEVIPTIPQQRTIR